MASENTPLIRANEKAEDYNKKNGGKDQGHLLMPPRKIKISLSRYTPPPAGVYGSVEENEASGSPILYSPSIKKRREPPSTSSSFPWVRARLTLLIVIFGYQVNINALWNIHSQYFHYFIHNELVNDSVVSISAHSNASNCDANVSDPATVAERQVQKQVSEFNLIQTYVTIAPSLTAIIVFGALSDALGRRFLFALAFSVMVGKYLIYLFIMGFGLQIWYTTILNFFEACSGGPSVMMLATYAYTADLSSAGKTRTLSLIFTEFVLSAATILTNLGVGYLIENLGYFKACIPPTAFLTASWLIAVLFLPETVTKPEKSQPMCQTVKSYVKNSFRFYISEGSVRQRLMFVLALTTFGITIIAANGYYSILVLTQLGQPYCWDPEKIAIYWTIGSAAGSVSSLVMVHVLQLFMSDPMIVVVAQLSRIANFTVVGLAQNTMWLYWGMIAGLVSGPAAGVNRAIMSRMAGSKNQGALFSSLSMVECVCNLISVTLWNTVYEGSVQTVPGEVFFVMGGIASLDLFLLLVFYHQSQHGATLTIYETTIQTD